MAKTLDSNLVTSIIEYFMVDFVSCDKWHIDCRQGLKMCFFIDLFLFVLFLIGYRCYSYLTNAFIFVLGRYQIPV